MLLTSDLFGIESHGMQRLVRYHKCIEKGMIKIDAKMACAEGLMGFSCTSSEAIMVPTFGRKARLGSNPIACAFPAKPQSETIPDQRESQILARILMKHRVIFVSRPEMETTLREMKMEYAKDLGTAIAMARQEKGENASVTLIPNGISVMVKQ